MGILKTLMLTCTLSLSVTGTTLRAQSLATDDPLQLFATCAGRLSAVMEYQWIFDGPASEITQSQRDNVVQLIDAVMPADQTRQVMQWRIAAKYAHAALLSRATFNDDPSDAAWADRMAARLTRECTGLLLS